MERADRVLANRYELHAVLGRGGMATVYRGTDRVLGRTVAVKIPLDRFAADEHFLARFGQEARAAAGLNHPNIVAVFDTGTDGETHFIVVEYVPGQTLAEALVMESPFPVGRAIAISVTVARALQAAHDQGLIHRDVKPGNIMLTPNGTVKVMDFGIASATADDRYTESSWGPRPTSHRSRPPVRRSTLAPICIRWAASRTRCSRDALHSPVPRRWPSLTSTWARIHSLRHA